MGARDKTAFAMVARIRAIVHTSFSLSTLFSRRALALCRRAPGDVAKLEIDKAARRQHGKTPFLAAECRGTATASLGQHLARPPTGAQHAAGGARGRAFPTANRRCVWRPGAFFGWPQLP